jgi:hypothetical protein
LPLPLALGTSESHPRPWFGLPLRLPIAAGAVDDGGSIVSTSSSLIGAVVGATGGPRAGVGGLSGVLIAKYARLGGGVIVVGIGMGRSGGVAVACRLSVATSRSTLYDHFVAVVLGAVGLH